MVHNHHGALHSMNNKKITEFIYNFLKLPLRGRACFSIRSLPSYKMNEVNSLDYFVRDNRYNKSSDYHHVWDACDQTGIEVIFAHENRNPIELEVYYIADVTSPEKISEELAHIGLITDKIISDKKFRWFG